MQAKLLAVLFAALFEAFDAETLREFADNGLDWIENKVLGSASQVDDKVVLPIAAQIRKLFNIPDNDEPPVE